MANPGTSICPSHTLAGPSTPSSYSTAKTRPPFASILAYKMYDIKRLKNR